MNEGVDKIKNKRCLNRKTVIIEPLESWITDRVPQLVKVSSHSDETRDDARFDSEPKVQGNVITTDSSDSHSNLVDTYVGRVDSTRSNLSVSNLNQFVR